MAWEYVTPFEAIAFHFGLAEKEVVALMRKNSRPSSFKMWRRRMAGRTTLDIKLRLMQAGRFLYATDSAVSVRIKSVKDDSLQKVLLHPNNIFFTQVVNG
jgi:uncharacterized protein (TIGR03643 family)